MTKSTKHTTCKDNKMPIDTIQKDLLIHISLFLGSEDRKRLGCTAKPFKNLDIENCYQITDLSPLASYTALTMSEIDLSPLVSCTPLTDLILGDCNQITDLSLFANHPTPSSLISPDGEKVDLTSLSNTQQPSP